MSVFADEFPGLDTSAKISAAIKSLPSDGGIVDATRIQKLPIPIKDHDEITCDFNSTIFVTKPVKLLLGAVNYTTSVDPVFSLSANFSLWVLIEKLPVCLQKIAANYSSSLVQRTAAYGLIMAQDLLILV